MNTKNAAYKRFRPAFKSTGGKYYLAPKFLPFLPTDGTYTRQVETFGRGFSLTLAMPPRPHVREIWNDLDHKLFNVYVALQCHTDTFVSRLRSVGYTEDTFIAARERDEQWDPDHAAPLDVEGVLSGAVDTFVRLCMSRGGNGDSFAWSERLRGGKPGDLNGWETRLEMLPALARRITNVEFRCGCGIAMMEEQSVRTDTFWYLDPPYMPKTRTARAVYGQFEMSPEQHERLAVAANACRGPVVISGYHCDEYDRWYRGWNRFEFDVANHAGQNSAKQRRVECIYTNFEPLAKAEPSVARAA